MSKIKIITDSGCDLINKCEDVIVVPYLFNRDKEEVVYKDNGKYSRNVLLDYMYLGVKCNVYRPAYVSYVEAINDRDTYYIVLPTISYDSNGIIEENVSVINTGLSSGAMGLLISDLQILIDGGSSVSDILDYINKNMFKYSMLIVPNESYIDALEVKKSNSNLLKKLFNMKPILTIDKEGSLVVTGTYKNMNDLCINIKKALDKKDIVSYDENSIRLLHSYKTLCEVMDLPNSSVLNYYNDLPIESSSLGITSIGKYGHKVLELAYKEI